MFCTWSDASVYFVMLYDFMSQRRLLHQSFGTPSSSVVSRQWNLCNYRSRFSTYLWWGHCLLFLDVPGFVFSLGDCPRLRRSWPKPKKLRRRQRKLRDEPERSGRPKSCKKLRTGEERGENVHELCRMCRSFRLSPAWSHMITVIVL